MPECPSCRTRYSGGATLCRNCGRAVPPVEMVEAALAEKDLAEVLLAPGEPRPHVAPNGLRICPRCGRVVPVRQRACRSCRDERGAPVGPVEVARRVDDASWAHVAFEWACAGCSRRVPFTSLADDGRAVCPGCGHAQELPALLWRTVLRHAHAVADLAGPDPEGGLAGRPSIGALNALKGLGVDAREAPGERLRLADDVPSELVAGPGHPICACGSPVDPRWRGGPHRCSCGVTHSGEVPLSVRRGMPRGVAALVVDRPLVTAPAGPRGAAVALECPRCHAPLDAPEGARRAVCKYCGTTAAIVDPAAPATAAPTTAPSPSPAAAPRLWILFRGPSSTRAELESKAAR